MRLGPFCLFKGYKGISRHILLTSERCGIAHRSIRFFGPIEFRELEIAAVYEHQDKPEWTVHASFSSLVIDNQKRSFDK